jgi:hypothetical protein
MVHRVDRRSLAICLVSLLSFPALTAAEQSVPLKRTRPAALVPLYVTFGALQAVDVHSTHAAVAAGAREANPLVRAAIDDPARMMLLKSGATLSVVWLSEKLWRRNRAAAVLTMIAMNSAYATIAAHNYRTPRR